MADQKITIRIKKSEIQKKPRAGVHPSRIEIPKKKYQRKPKHPSRKRDSNHGNQGGD